MCNFIKYGILCLVCILLGTACQNKKKEEALSIIKQWAGKELLFPPNALFTTNGSDTTNMLLADVDYKVVTYVDSAGCTLCRFKPGFWQDLMEELEASSGKKIAFLFFLAAKDKQELFRDFRRDGFSYPVCVDNAEEFDRLNGLPTNEHLRTFLLDKANKVLALGNPIEQSRIRKLYTKILIEKTDEQSSILTTARLEPFSIDFGAIPKGEKKSNEVLIVNTGDKPLVINKAAASCSCTKIEHDKHPALPGDSLRITVNYQSEEVGYFKKTVFIYCNTEDSPIRLIIQGNTK